MGKVKIALEDITKAYSLYASRIDRLKEALHPYRKKYHRDFFALKNINLNIKKGETIGIIGKNGSGKSTLLKIAAGISTPTAGSIFISGKVLALLELGTGFNPEITGFENIYLYGSLLGAHRKEIDRKIPDILSFAEIGDYINQPVKTFSSGMYLRLAFAVIANMETEIIIIDEALAVGDAFFIQKCMRFLREFQNYGTIVFVSHDLGAILSLCNRAIWLDNGEVKQIGKPKNVCEKYLEAVFHDRQGGSGHNNFKNACNIIKKTRSYSDQRKKWINKSPYRNDIKVFEFDPSANHFGEKAVYIFDLKLLDNSGAQLLWVVGGEKVILNIRGKSTIKTANIIVGFYIKDRLGQYLFGDNTFLSTLGEPVSANIDQVIEAIFEFHMPILPLGDYTICAAIAEGTQENHIIHHWIHDALVFKSQSSSISTGLLGIPMDNVSLTVHLN
jgi:lipopolysaccharide transport system ATP-binding protein